MNYVFQAYTLSALAALIGLMTSSLWMTYLTVRKRLLTWDFQLALIAVHITLLVHVGFILMLWLNARLREPMTTVAYGVIAVAIVPSVWIYIPKETPRQHAMCIGLSCLFAAGMVVRALQTALGGQT